MIPNHIQRRAPFLFFLSFYLILCAFLYKDFGISWDEYDCYSIGSALFHYLVGNGWNAKDFLEKVGGWDAGWNPNFWIPYDYWYTAFLYAFNRGFSLELFHWMNMALAGFMFWGAYEVLLDVTESPWGSLAAPLALLWTPRLMGYIPINPRDGAFAVFFFIALVGVYFFGDPTRSKRGDVPFKNVLLLGLLVAFAQSTRLVGLALYPLWALYGGFCIWIEPDSGPKDKVERAKTLLTTMFWVMVLAHLFMFWTWPYIGANVLRHYIEILKVTARFPSTPVVFFMGHKVLADALPWYYLPVWVWISTPLVVLLPAVVSPVVLWPAKGRRLYFLLLAAVLGTLLLWIVVRPIIYGDYRHFLFILPPFSVLGGWTLWRLFQMAKGRRARGFLLSLVAFGAVVSMVEIARLHPYEYIYMNECVGGVESSYHRYPTEVVGSGLKECGLWLGQNLPTVPGRPWKVNTMAQPFQSFYYFPKHIKWSEYEDADFFVAFSDCSGFFDKQNRYQSLVGWVPIHTVERRGVPLYYIYKRR